MLRTLILKKKHYKKFVQSPLSLNRSIAVKLSITGPAITFNVNFQIVTWCEFAGQIVWLFGANLILKFLN